MGEVLFNKGVWNRPPTPYTTPEAGKNPFFKEVLGSQQAFVNVVVPYCDKINGLYFNHGMESPNK